MGYNVFLLKADFLLRNEKQAGALNAIKGLKGRETNRFGDQPHFSFVDPDFYSLHKIEVVLQKWRWLPQFDDEGNIYSLEFSGEKLGDDELLFREIAPYVERGSYVIMAGENGTIWRWLFDGNTVHYQPGRIIFENDE